MLKNIYLLTGNGWGKTTSALGVALRSIGHGAKVVIVQFMKGRKETGEYKVMRRLKPNYSIHQFGRREFIDLKKPGEKDKKLARDGFEFAKKKLKEKLNLLILDEINLAIRIGLLKEKDVIDFLDSVPKNVTVYLTGRYATKGMMRRADYVTEVNAKKNPAIRNQKAKKGIDY